MRLSALGEKKRGDMAKVVNGMTVPQLTKKANYDNWCLQMKTLLGSQDIWDIVESGYEEPAEDANQTATQITALKKTRVKDNWLCISCTMRWTSQASRRLQTLHLQRKHGLFWRLHTRTTRLDKSGFKLLEESLKG